MILTLLGAVAAVLGISLLIVLHELGHFLVARAFGMKVERFSVGFGPVLAALRLGGTEFVVSALPLGGYVRIAGMAPGDEVNPDDPGIYANQAAWRRFLTILAGPAANYLAAALLGAALLLGPGLRTADPGPAVGRLVPGYPAEQAGLRDGDRVREVAGAPVATWEELVSQLQAHPGRAIALRVERGEGAAATSLTLSLLPRDEGGVGRAGFEQHQLWQRSDGIAAALAEALRRTDALALSQVTVFGKLFSGGKGTKLSGPIGIGQQLLRAAREGPAAFVNLLWVISAVLAVLNLFPLPALDGGRLVFLAYEVVARRRVNARIESVVHMVGFVALIALLLGVTVFGDLDLAGRIARLGGR
ncbi:MAG TPA: M50 family metallopeptidase [Anaeromyxobacter sp.]|nr:M50 family metallopeptidase [Anaeromyxobacter sp.]